STYRQQRDQAPAEKRALPAHHPVALQMPGLHLVYADHLDRPLARFGARIVEEHGIGEAVGSEPLGEPLLPRDLEQVRAVRELLRLRGNRLDQARVAMAERGDGDAAGKVEKFAAVGRIEIEAFAPLDGDVPPAIGRHYSWNHGLTPAR